MLLEPEKLNVSNNKLILEIKELLPNILKQLGPKQFGFIKDYVETIKGNEKKKDEPAPDLVEDFEEVSKQN